MSNAVSDWLDDLPPLRAVIAAHDLRADKKFGQNFILDRNITDKIARQAGDLSRHAVIEIGSGPGGLTRSLLRTGARQVTAIEYDPRAIAALGDLEEAASGRLRVIQADALDVDPRTLTDAPRAIVANLPYNIATPLLTGWLAHLRDDPDSYDVMVLMFQKEVVGRMVATPGGGAYGRLSVLVQWLCTAEACFDLPPSAFMPPPKVTSSVVRLCPRRLDSDAPSLKSLETITAAAFQQRRKMLKSGLRAFPGLMAQAGIDETLRPEQLRVEDFVTLAKCLENAAPGC